MPINMSLVMVNAEISHVQIISLTQCMISRQIHAGSRVDKMGDLVDYRFNDCTGHSRSVSSNRFTSTDLKSYSWRSFPSEDSNTEVSSNITIKSPVHIFIITRTRELGVGTRSSMPAQAFILLTSNHFIKIIL